MTSKNKTEPEELKNEIDNSAKLFDVAKPGKTPPSATSRPVIVGHGSMVKNDPMVVRGDTEKDEGKQPFKISVRELKIVPDNPEAAEEDITASESEEDGAAAEEPPAETPAQEEVVPAASETGVVDSLMNEVDAKQADKKQKKELETLTNELEKSIEAKEFFVPIGLESRHRSNQILLILVLILVLGVAGLNFAIDAEVVNIGIDPFTDFI